MILEGKSEDKKKVSEGEENEGEKNLAQSEKEASKGCAELGFFAFGHGVRE
jgi:hypothetical protein